MSSIKERYKLAWEQRYTPKSRLRTKRKQGWSEMENINWLKRTAKQTLENFRVYYISQGAHTITLLLSDGRHQETFHKPFSFSFSFTVFKITVGGGEEVEGEVEGGWLVGTGGFITRCEGGADTGLFCLDIPTGRSSTWGIFGLSDTVPVAVSGFCTWKCKKKNNKKKRQNSYRQYANEEQVFPSVYRSDKKKGFICWMILCVFLSILGPNNLKATYQCLRWRNQRCWYGWRSRCRRTGKQNYSASIHWFSIKREARVF